ncbi:hypothetical protein, partial [Bacillus thuringiensis]|uniref:hypothetical protein n=1 Tax=Bacillus thuringiensis TaxID=1428 RepID=UPI002175D22F
RGVRAALAGEDARVAAAVAGERERQGVVDDALKSLPVLITMLKTAGLVKGADVAEQMYQRAAAIRETPSA